MMKWSNNHRESSDEESEDIRRSIEALDKVLDEFDDISPITSKVRKKKSDTLLNHSSTEKCENISFQSKAFDPVKQSLDILDTVLAQFEEEIIQDTKENALSNRFHDSYDESTEIDRLRESNDAEQAESHGSNDNLASPTSKQGKKISPPPVPKRSPTTCLSCSSSFECPSPEDPTSNKNPFFSESSISCQCNSTDCSAHSKKHPKHKGKLSSKPVKKGSSRPRVKANDSGTSQDDLSDEDDVFHSCASEINKLADKNSNNFETDMSKLRDAKIRMTDTKIANPTNADQKKMEILNVTFNLKEKFALAKYLLKTGQLQGLDEEPPSFKPPPIPLPPKTKINKGKNSSNTRWNEDSSTDPNGNEVTKCKNEFLINSETVQTEMLSTQHHVTSVKITQPSTANHSKNVSVITIQPKTLAISKEAPSIAVTKPALPPKDNQRVALSTFTRSSNNNSKSSSLEDVCSAKNTRTQEAVIAADMLGMTKTGSLPLELKKPSVPTAGAVFFNVFECPEGEKPIEASNPAENSDKTKDKKDSNKKQGWKKKKKNKEKPKDSANNTAESVKANMDQNALLAELTGKIQTKVSATPNGSSSEDSDQGATQHNEPLDKVVNAKDDKGIWKGFWKKKQVTET